MTDRKLPALALVCIVLVAVATGGTTYALLTDTESVDVSVTIDTVPGPSGMAASGNDAPPAVTVTCAPSGDEPHSTTGPSSNTTVNVSVNDSGASDDAARGNAGPPCPTVPTNGTNTTDSTIQNETVGDGNETVGDGNETVGDGNETVGDGNETVGDGNETTGENASESDAETGSDSDTDGESGSGSGETAAIRVDVASVG